MTNDSFTRRALLGAGAALPLFTLPSCLSPVADVHFGDAIRRLLAMAAQRALAGLVQTDGYYNDPIAQVTLPPWLGGMGAPGNLAEPLRAPALQERLLRLINGAASESAAAAGPILLRAIPLLQIHRAEDILRGNASAATAYLRKETGPAVRAAFLAALAPSLARRDDGALAGALAAAHTGMPSLAEDAATKAADGLYRAIGRAEGMLRADPDDGGDPVIARVFTIIHESQ